MSDEPKVLWGSKRFTWVRQDVETLIKLIEANRPIGGISIGKVFDAMNESFADKQPRDPELLIQWMEKIIHLMEADVQNIPGFLCDTDNPYRFPSHYELLPT